MWQSRIDLLDDGRTRQLSIVQNDNPLSYAQVLRAWLDDSEFREYWIAGLRALPYAAYFWETRPVTTETVNQAFECVFTDSPALAGVKPDTHVFEDYFKEAKKQAEVVSFANLGKDALLVAPCPGISASAYTHLATFTKDAPTTQQHRLWQRVGQEVEARLSNQPLWLSTSGLGVYWLHIRLDRYPKYYNFHEYKMS